MPTADLGWCFARCVAGDESALTICSPASDGDAAETFTLCGLEAIVALRDLIDEAIAVHQATIDLPKDLAPGD